LVAVERRLASIEGVFAVIESDELVEDVSRRTVTNEVEFSVVAAAAAAAAARGGRSRSAGLVAGRRRAEWRGHGALNWSGGVSVLKKWRGGGGDQRGEAGGHGMDGRKALRIILLLLRHGTACTLGPRQDEGEGISSGRVMMMVYVVVYSLRESVLAFAGH